MEIVYKDFGRDFENKIYFRDQAMNCFYYFSVDGKIIFKPEGGVIPPNCTIHLPDIITKERFEDAVLELAKKIKYERNEKDDISGETPMGEDDIIHFQPQPSITEKLVDIIIKLTNK